MTTCGIDIGLENMAIAFLDEDNQITIYKGVVNGKESYMNRYRENEEPIQLKLEMCVDIPRDICQFLALIPEFMNTERVFIELQVGMHSTAIIKLEGVIMGFLLGRYRSLQVDSCSSSKRTNFATKFISQYGQSSIQIVGSPPKTKHDTMYMIGHLYKDMYNHMLQYVKSSEWNIGKMDDVCDTIAYAHMARSEKGTISKVTSKAASSK